METLNPRIQNNELLNLYLISILSSDKLRKTVIIGDLINQMSITCKQNSLSVFVTQYSNTIKENTVMRCQVSITYTHKSQRKMVKEHKKKVKGIFDVNYQIILEKQIADILFPRRNTNKLLKTIKRGTISFVDLKQIIDRLLKYRGKLNYLPYSWIEELANKATSKNLEQYI